MKYCPNCGSGYRAGFEECWDCQVPLVDEQVEPVEERKLQPTARDRAVVFRSGRRMDAELVRARLEADGMEAHIWSSGLSRWRLESALTEVTGVPSDFNSHQVVVDPDDVPRAREVLDEVVAEREMSDETDPTGGSQAGPGFLALLRQRWALLAFAFFLLLIVLVAGPPGT